jgi:hypothetical protein
MLANLINYAIVELEGAIVEVETDISAGSPTLKIVDMLSLATKFYQQTLHHITF